MPDPSKKGCYISITGLELRHWWHFPRFAWHAMRSMAQARAADGNISATARTINGVNHTMTVWENETAMRRFLYRGAHRQAIAAFPAIADGKTFGFHADAPPGWDEVPHLLSEQGRDYTPPAKGDA